MRPTKIIVHHSLTKDSGTVSWGAIRRYHINEMGMVDIGYHAGVELVLSGDEITYETLMGRMWDVEGAHTKGQNQDSLGICFIGNFDLEEPSEEQLKAGAKVIALWMRIFGISTSSIFPHSYFASYKSCPGTRFSMPKLLQIVGQIP